MAELRDGLILLAGGRETIRNRDVPHHFRQRSDFLYLAGVEEPGYDLLLDPKAGKAALFIPRVDSKHRVWLGHVPGPAQTRSLFGISRVLFADELPAELKRLRRGRRKVYTDKASLALHRSVLRGLRAETGRLPDALDALRAVKDGHELRLMAEASRITGAAHLAAMKAARPGMMEYEVQAVYEAVCRRSGLKHQAYLPIVAAGRNAAILHYGRNDARIRKGQLLLIDAGAENHGYAADITRTFPVGARFSPRQRDIYAIVLDAQKACIAAARAGLPYADLHGHSARRIAAGLKELKLLRGPVESLVESGAVRLFYPHGLGHLLGLDVHDGAGGRRRRLARSRKSALRFSARLEPGFVLTIEPGIYFIEALLRDPALRRKHRGAVDFSRAESFLGVGGVRIEDDVLIRRSGPPRNLTAVPKEIREIESRVSRRA